MVSEKTPCSLEKKIVIYLATKVISHALYSKGEILS